MINKNNIGEYEEYEENREIWLVDLRVKVGNYYFKSEVMNWKNVDRYAIQQ